MSWKPAKRHKQPTSTFGYVRIDGDAGTILDANESLHRLLGWADGELIGKDLDVLVPAERRGRHRLNRARYMAAPTNRQMGPARGVWCVRKDGSRLQVWIGLSALNGVVTAAIAPVRL